jgi:hypothetical protein
MTTSSCTAAVKLEGHGDPTNRCLADPDCTAKDPGSRCDLVKHACVRIESFCATNAECIQRAGANYTCTKTPNPQDNHCTALLSPECSTILADEGDLANDDVLILGLPWPGETWGPAFIGGAKAVDMARKDFKRVSGGLPALPGKKGPRPIAVVECDIPQPDPTKYMPAIDHLVNVGVKAFIGPVMSEWISYGLLHALPQNIAIFSPDSPSQGLQGDTHSLYFTNGTPPGGSTVRSLLVSVHEDILRSEGKTGDVKVAMVASGLAFEAGITKFIHDTLSFNGKSAADNGANYIEADYGDVNAEGGAASPRLAAAVQQIIAFNPDIVVMTGRANELAIKAIEKVIHPRYALPTVNQTDSLAKFLDTQPNGLKRVLGERSGRVSTDTRVTTFNQRFNGTYPEAKGQAVLAALMYDLFYYVAYAAAGVGAQPIDGTSLGTTVLNRFRVGGAPVSTSPDKIFATFQALEAGNNVDMDGVASVGVFKPDGTLSYADLVVWCFGSDTSVSPRSKDAGFTYRSDQPSALIGKLTCF